MSLRGIWSFDDMATADIGTQFTYASSAFIVAGRNTNGGMGSSISKIFNSQQKWITGCAILFTVVPSISNFYFLIKDGDIFHLSFTLDASMRLRIHRGDYYSTVIATSENSFSTNIVYYLEIKVIIGDAGVGSYEVRVNGSSVGWFPPTSADTRNGGNATANSILINNQSAGYIDDLYICDGVDSGVTGMPNNDFLGDIRNYNILPTGAGNYSQWTKTAPTYSAATAYVIGDVVDSGGTFYNCIQGGTGKTPASNPTYWQAVSDNYAFIDDPTNRGDIGYNADSVAEHKDSFTFPAPAMTAGTIPGVLQNIVCRKDDAGTKIIRPVCRIGGTDYFGDSVSIGNSYNAVQYIWQKNPATASDPWTLATLATAEFGYELVS